MHDTMQFVPRQIDEVYYLHTLTKKKKLFMQVKRDCAVVRASTHSDCFDLGSVRMKICTILQIRSFVDIILPGPRTPLSEQFPTDSGGGGLGNKQR